MSCIGEKTDLFHCKSYPRHVEKVKSQEKKIQKELNLFLYYIPIITSSNM